LSDIELAFMADRRVLRSTDQIWCSGLPNWVVAGTVPGLLHADTAASVAEGPRRAEAAPRAAHARVAQSSVPKGPSLLDLYEQKFAAGKDGPPPSAASAAADTRIVSSTPPPPALSTLPARAVSTRPADTRSTGLAAVAGGQPRPTAAAAMVPAVQSPAASSLPGLRGARQIIARTVLAALDAHEIRTLADLTNDDRLRAVASFTFDLLPMTVRFTVGQIVGRDGFEYGMFVALTIVRSRIPPNAQAEEVKELVITLLESDWLERNAQAFTHAVSGGLRSAYDALPSLQKIRSGLTGFVQNMTSAVRGAAPSPMPTQAQLMPPMATG
jgi:hypothetical protein